MIYCKFMYRNVNENVYEHIPLISDMLLYADNILLFSLVNDPAETASTHIWRYSHFIPPENTRKPKDFRRYKMGDWPEMD